MLDFVKIRNTLNACTCCNRHLAWVGLDDEPPSSSACQRNLNIVFGKFFPMQHWACGGHSLSLMVFLYGIHSSCIHDWMMTKEHLIHSMQWIGRLEVTSEYYQTKAVPKQQNLSSNVFSTFFRNMNPLCHFPLRFSLNWLVILTFWLQHKATKYIQWYRPVQLMRIKFTACITK